MANWKKYLQEQARVCRMCADNRAYLNACETKEDAIRLYKQTVDWALERNYPNLEFLRAEFADNEKDGIYIDKHFDGDVLNEHQAYVFHHCSGTVRVGLNFAKKIIPMCYFANNCDMTILGLDGEKMFPDRVPLYIFGENKIEAKNSSTMEAKIYRGEVKV